jgi:surface antigen
MPKRSTAALCAAALAMAITTGSAVAADLPGKGDNAAAAASLPAKTSGWQCAQFARIFSGIQIFGDAWTWWSQALGKYARGFTPEAGSVLVFKPYGPMTRGHVAVVSQVLTDRIIQVTHANWSPVDGRRGKVEKDVTVVDVSKVGDWSQVKVFYNPTGDLGTTVYPTYGFVYKAAKAAMASLEGQH